MTPPVHSRAVMRAVGQVGLVVTAASALWLLLWDLRYGCMPNYQSSLGCEGRTWTDWLISPGDYLLTLVLSLAMLWASGHAARTRLTVTLGALHLTIVLGRATVLGLTGYLDPALIVSLTTCTLIGAFWSLGSIALLLLSYRPPAPQLDEPTMLGHRSLWLWLGLVPVQLALPLGDQANRLLGITQASTLPLLLYAAALYGLARRIRPIPGAAPWLPVAATLTALTLPIYVWEAVDTRFHLDDGRTGLATAAGYAAACAVAVLTVATLTGLAVWRHHRRPTHVITEASAEASTEARAEGTTTAEAPAVSR